MKIPILCYHSTRVLGPDYARNDHVALARDLRAIHACGLRVVPLSWVVDWVLGERPGTDLDHAVALTFDDGCTLDFRDLAHPTWGPQRSFRGILEEFRAEVGAAVQPHLEGTCFVIASPEARREIGRRCLIDETWLADDWWPDASRSGLLSIQSHGWDHNHPAADRVCQREQRKGRFDVIETFEECECEVARAAAWIDERIAPARVDLLAYPWGQSSAYLREVYLPRFGERHGTRAAFAADGGFVTQESSRWELPRFGFGAHWTDPEGLERILEEAAA